MSQIEKERGIATILIVVLAALVFAAVGYAIYNAQENSNQTATSDLPSGTSSPEPTTSGKPGESQAYMDIKELGVRLPLSADIEDLTYFYEANIGAANLSSKSVADRTGGSCAAGPGVGPLETLHRSATYPTGLDSTSVKQIKGNYFYLRNPQAACSEDASAVALMAKQREAVHEAFKSIAPIE